MTKTPEIIDAIKSVAKGHRLFSSRLTPYLIDLRHRVTTLIQQHPELDALTERERQILLLLSEAMTSREIAAELYLSHRTVENHLGSIREKLNMKRHHHLLKFAIEHKIELLGKSLI